MPDYSRGKIYKITCLETDEVYYGSTTHSLNDRISGHRYDARNDINITSSIIINRNNYQEEFVEKYTCNSKEELETRERWWIENNVCVNKHIPHRTQKEYYEDNKEKFKQYSAEYREDNRDKLNEYIKQYRKANKEELSEKQNEKFTCECGVIYARRNKIRHIKSKKHQDFISHHTDTH